MGKYDTCTICKKDFEWCPHSWTDRDEHDEEQKIRRIVRDELKKAGLIN